MRDGDLKSAVQPHVPSNNQKTSNWTANTWQAWTIARYRLSGGPTEHVSTNLL